MANQTKIHALLDEFTRLMHEDDPARVRSPDPTEYEGEALQCLARFAGERLSSAAGARAATIVRDVFEAWFRPAHVADTTGLSSRLLAAYAGAYVRKVNAAGDLP